MIRWMLVVVIALLVFQGLTAWLRRYLGFGRLPGDFVFRAFGRQWDLPLGSTVLLSLVAAAIAHWI
ncbi:DUF2905 domain-containing protein [Variovorax dokdonensis]|uniref:DUF2905 domain-containing protein n=2 Tax=Variovorax dokdonensis TaxID=344883 RepID=A0ABT7N5L8_9BURK|nr:DUF2905 domain-containing protein [Variovorax dokdonensis]MDM0043215.1 DUF2905 domain-containing protein [Variovorax dokdonensis]